MESGGESRELLRRGDIAEVIAPCAWREVPVGTLVVIRKTPWEDSTYTCYMVDGFLRKLQNWQVAISPDRLKLFWRPGAPDAQ